MSGDNKTTARTREAFSLKRWSRLKQEAARTSERPAEGTSGAVTPPPQETAGATASPPAAEPAALPPVESLNFDSDFSEFLRPQVDEGLKRRALKKLFSDARFNVMDGLDVYIDDYSKPDPLAPDIARALADACSILDKPVAPDAERQTPAATAADGDASVIAEAADASTASAPSLAQAEEGPAPVAVPEQKPDPVDAARAADSLPDGK